MKREEAKLYQSDAKLENTTGLHARPASIFVKEAAQFKSDISVIKDTKECDAKSLISLLSLGAGKGTKLTIKAEGEDEKEAVESLKVLIANKFGE